MSDDPNKPRPGEEGLSEEERNRRRAERMSQEIAHKYDPAQLAKTIIGDAGKGEKLDLATKSEMESRIGGSFGDVRIIRGKFADAVARAHRADAVTVATTGMILVREGARSDPKTALGKALLAHELTHVKQAQRGLHLAADDGSGQASTQEQEAEAVEADVYHTETGQKKDRREIRAAVPIEARNERIRSRAIEMIEEEERTLRERLGYDDGDG